MSRTRPAPQAVRYTVNPTRFSDMLSNRVETREWQCGRQHARPNGRSFVVLRCPFCGGDQEVKVWSLRGGGKRCELPDCGAMFGSNGRAFRLADEFRIKTPRRRGSGVTPKGDTP